MHQFIPSWCGAGEAGGSNHEGSRAANTVLISPSISHDRMDDGTPRGVIINARRTLSW